jgi:CPA1 family monovalent cation:H+ antiporter
VEGLLQTETLIIELLLVVLLVAIGVRRLRIPYTVALVLSGLVLATVQTIEVQLTPQVILALFVPPLVFEAAFHLDLRRLRENLTVISGLAIIGVLLTTLIIGGVVSLGTGLAVPTALVLGALLAATDPVSVVALFRELGAPRRLSTIVEGESLFNDGIAIVVFSLALEVALAGRFNLSDGIAEFIRVSAGGLVIGAVLGSVVNRLIARLDDYLIETTLTTVLAYGSYLLAEQFHVSGVLAVVAAGLLNGNLGPAGMSPTTKVVLFNFWEYVVFLANSLVFLLLGLTIDVRLLVQDLIPIAWAVGGALLSRAIAVYTLAWLVSRFSDPIPPNWRHVMFWGGLRGAISLALALSLPLELGPDRDVLRVMAFGVVLFTLLAQGTTMQVLLSRLRLAVKPTGAELELERHQGRLLALRAGWHRLEELHEDGVISDAVWEVLSAQYRHFGHQVESEVRSLYASNAQLAQRELVTAEIEGLQAQRSALRRMLYDGLIMPEVFQELVEEIDQRLDSLNKYIMTVHEEPSTGPEEAPQAPSSDRETVTESPMESGAG